MSHRSASLIAPLRAVAFASAFALATASAALAQQVVVVVSGEPVTSFDIDQRSRLLQLMTQKPPPRQEVIDELIADLLKVREARRFSINITDKELT